MAYTYIIKCRDDTYYTGIAKDIYNRMEEHWTKSKKCAKYTRAKGIKSLEILWESKSISDAAKLETQIKKLTRLKKIELIMNPDRFEKYFGQKLDCANYFNCPGITLEYCLQQCQNVQK
ncbi:GIY-YIG nuclease family protein [Parasporobacterium paucivorans]|uniref:Predicted endonuclease, GIY-YIG superfamily n=1 Tax=Parasporobacterium paucivorans DSM 15970 TaxID=1122934 RepID=A0A1M6DPJ3_9FIRM|nr:GIY-YIG nuclease family protein [Parasporobacterium paucivorans]SHI74928.1 Predicted endonuclease, GIY-YIG superfamily [Parasporobacterium paucivorans DSM 15970]